MKFPTGGAEDFLGTFGSIADAKAYLADHPQEWAHIAIFDHRRLKIPCAYGAALTSAAAGVAAWHDCTD